MRSRAKAVNPFYWLLVAAGVAFTITACAYGVLTVKGLAPFTPGGVAAPHPLLAWLDRHGGTLLAAELVVLGLASALAMATDSYWTRLADARPGDTNKPGDTTDAAAPSAGLPRRPLGNSPPGNAS